MNLINIKKLVEENIIKNNWEADVLASTVELLKKQRLNIQAESLDGMVKGIKLANEKLEQVLYCLSENERVEADNAVKESRLIAHDCLVTGYRKRDNVSYAEIAVTLSDIEPHMQDRLEAFFRTSESHLPLILTLKPQPAKKVEKVAE